MPHTIEQYREIDRAFDELENLLIVIPSFYQIVNQFHEIIKGQIRLHSEFNNNEVIDIRMKRSDEQILKGTEQTKFVRELFLTLAGDSEGTKTDDEKMNYDLENARSPIQASRFEEVRLIATFFNDILEDYKRG